MNEEFHGEAIRLQVVNGKVKMGKLSSSAPDSPAPSSHWGTLYAVSHAVSRSGGGELVCDRVEGVARETYRRSQGGVTNRLRQAVRNANRYLYLRNRVRPEGQELLASLGCVAMRGMDTYACGVGAHCILILSRGRVRTFANRGSRLESTLTQSCQANGSLLGHRRTLTDPQISYRQILPGECLLIMAAADVQVLEQAANQLGGISDRGEMEALAKDLGKSFGRSTDLSALLVRASPEGAHLPEGSGDFGAGVTMPVPSPPHGSASSRQSDDHDADARDGSLRNMHAMPIGQENVTLKDARPVGGFAALRSTGYSQGKQMQAPGRRRDQPQEVFGHGLETTRLAATWVLSVLLGVWQGTIRLLRSCVDLSRRLWIWIRQNRVIERMGRGCQLALIGLWAASKGLMVRILPERQGPTVTYGASARPMAKARVIGFHPSPRSRTLMGALIMLGVVALVGTAAVRVRGRLVQAEMETLATEVRERLVLAAEEDDTEATLALLAEAQQLVDQSDINVVDSTELSQVLEEMDRQWDKLTGSVRITFREEDTLATPDQATRRMLVHGDELYVLDDTGQRLYRYALDEEGALVAEQEPWIWEPSADTEGVPGAEIVDMEWIEAANGRLTAALLMLTSEGTILELNSDGAVRPVSIADAGLWESPRALRTYAGNLYVLDVARGNIVKYLPSGDDYPLAPVEYVHGSADIDWANVTDMAIDGFIYLLLSNGSIVKLAGGMTQPFPQDGLYPPLENPSAIFASPEASSVFVAEAGQGRMVEFNRDGQLIRQFGAAREGEDPLSDLRAFYVDVTHHRLLVGTGTGLANSDLPLLD